MDVKCCHGYLLNEMLAAHTRPGPYGGSFDNRTRLFREIVAAIRRDAPGLHLGVRVSAFDFVPFRHPHDREGTRGMPIDFTPYLPWRYGFGVNPDNPLQYDLAEPIRFLSLCRDLGIRLLNISAACPYYNPHLMRPAMFPPSDGYPPPEDPQASPEEQERRRAHAEYAAGNLAAAARAFGPRAPESVVETTLLAFGLSDAGDTDARPHLAALSRVRNTEAEAATATLAFRLGLMELARNALAASFVHYRDDPWPSQVSMAQALSLALQIAQVQRDAAPLLAEALSRPLAVAALEEPRRLVRVQLASLQPLSDRCRDALADLEPHVPWREDVLGSIVLQRRGVQRHLLRQA